MPNAYLEKRKADYRALSEKIQKAQDDAAKADKGLTEEEFRAVKADVDAAKALATEIEELTEHEVRAAKVGELAASLSSGEDGDGEPDADDETKDSGHRSATTTRQRDPGHYRSIKERGQHSFFSDMFNARSERGHQPDPDAVRRLAENQAYMRAVTTAGGALGIIPPKWLTDEYLKMGRQGRVVANLVRRLPIGDDPRPIVLPKQTAQVDPNLTAQTAEGTNNAGWGTDRFTTNDDTLTPVAEAAFQDVSRQTLAASTPNADVLIMQDLHDAWDLAMEKLVCTAITTGGTAFFTFATDYSVAAGTATATQFNYVVGGTGGGSAAINQAIDAQTAVANALYGPADIAVMNYSRFGKFRKLVDVNGRPYMPVSRYNPQNAAGALGNVMVGDIEGVDAYGTNGIPGTSVPSSEKFAILRSQAVLFAESDLLEFTYDQVVGPSSVRMGIWGYAGALARVPAAIQVFTVTAA